MVRARTSVRDGPLQHGSLCS